MTTFKQHGAFRSGTFGHSILVICSHASHVISLHRFRHVIARVQRSHVFSRLRIRVDDPRLNAVFCHFHFQESVDRNELRLVPLIKANRSLINRRRRDALFLFSAATRIQSRRRTDIFRPQLGQSCHLVISSTFTLSNLRSRGTKFVLRIIRDSLTIVRFLASPSIRRSKERPFLLQDQFRSQYRKRIVTEFSPTAISHSRNISRRFIPFLFRFIAGRFCQNLDRSDQQGSDRRDYYRVCFRYFLRHSSCLVGWVVRETTFIAPG